jgi:hypothetical protein
MIILYAVIAAIIGGLLNRLRGGWAVDSGINITHTVLRLIVSLFSTICLYVPLWINESFNSVDYRWFLGVWLFCFLALLPGWGSWYSIGRDKNSYQHNRDWILSEWITYKVYGPKWIPWSALYIPSKTKEMWDLKKRFNIIVSPNKKLRPYIWRRDMEYLAMAIRGLNFTIAAPLIFALHMYFEYNYKVYAIALIFPLGYLMAWMYEIGYKFDTSKLPKWMRSNTELGEVLTGATLMSSFLMIGSWISLKLI